jgi:hypothetical protein
MGCQPSAPPRTSLLPVIVLDSTPCPFSHQHIRQNFRHIRLFNHSDGLSRRNETSVTPRSMQFRFQNFRHIRLPNHCDGLDRRNETNVTPRSIKLRFPGSGSQQEPISIACPCSWRLRRRDHGYHINEILADTARRLQPSAASDRAHSHP